MKIPQFVKVSPLQYQVSWLQPFIKIFRDVRDIFLKFLIAEKQRVDHTTIFG